jgi:hypothetical protein
MRIVSGFTPVAGLLTVGVLVATSMTTVARAGFDQCCWAPLPRIVYGLPPAPFVIPPTGYVLAPSAAARPFYVVNQGFGGPDILTLARPTFSKGGYAYAHSWPHSRYPYVVSYGYGLDFGYRVYGPPRRHFFARPHRAPLHTAYR